MTKLPPGVGGGTTVTWNEQLATFPLASRAVQVTFVFPNGKSEPEAGTQVVVTPGQLSDAVGGAKLTIAPEVEFCTAIISAGQLIVGGVLSVTVTVNVQLAPPGSEQVTVVVPTGKQLSEAGLQVTVPQPPIMPNQGTTASSAPVAPYISSLDPRIIMQQQEQGR